MITHDAPLKLAIANHFQSAAEVLQAWQALLSESEKAKLAEWEAKGISLGVAASALRGQATIHVFGIDANGETLPLVEIGNDGIPTSTALN